MRRFLIALILCMAGALRAAAQPLPPELTEAVNDFAHVIDAQSKSEIEQRIVSLKNATGDVVVVATVDTIAPYADVREYIVKMFENHGRGIGQKGKDNGLLVLLTIKERRVQVEVGYDLEQFITDGYSGEVSRMMTNYFRSGEYGPGLLEGTTRIIGRIAQGRGVTLSNVPVSEPVQPTRALPISPGLIIILIIVIIILSNTGGRSGFGPRRRRWGGGPWSGWNSGVGPFGGGGGFGGGGFGGGFGGFGGGRSGGGGGGAGW